MKFSEHIRIFKKSIRHLFAMSRTYTICLVLNSILQSLLPYVPVYFSAQLIDGLYGGKPVGVLALYVSLTVGTVFLLSVCSAYLSARCSVSDEEIYRNEGWKYSEKAMQMAYASIEDTDVALLRGRITKESQTGYNLFFVHHCLEKIISNTLRILLSLSLTLTFFFLESVPFAMKLGLVGGILLTIVSGILTSGRAEKMTADYYAACVRQNVIGGKYYNYINNYTSGKDIRVYDMADGLLALTKSLMEQIQAQSRKLYMKTSALKLVDTVLKHALQFGVYLILIRAALLGGVTAGSIARYVSCVMLMLTAASGLAEAVQKALVNHKYLKRYFSYFEIPNSMYQGTLTVEKRDDREYFVEFRDVSFRYPGAEDYALRHVDLKFKVGEKLAVVGRNGSGKTTFIKLMCRLYDPTEGEILLNGVNIRKYDYDEYLSIFSIVFQDFQLFSFSLGENVAASPRYETKRAEQCLVQAGFGERLAAMPKGVESCLYKDFDPEGIEISGGEAQKIALARALYKDAPFLILDEPAAALDPISEYEVYSKFNEIAGDRTAIYISHRLASCRFCDKIAVFDGGKIVQMGGHESLLAQEDGKYHELWQAQAQYYTEENG